MLRRLIRQDIRRSRIATTILLCLIALSSFLAASAVQVFGTMQDALNSFFRVAETPGFVQLTEGPVNTALVRSWAAQQPGVKASQVSMMVNVPGESIYFNQDSASQVASVMNFDIVKQNKSFDFLLNQQQQRPTIQRGQIGVPMYFKKRLDLKLGDTVVFTKGAVRRRFIIRAFVRDSLMNPAVVHSKRFLVSAQDFSWLAKAWRHHQYLVGFRLYPAADFKAFHQAYQLSDLPKRGPGLTLPLIRLLNSLSDGLLVGVFLLLSVLVLVMALLCLRFALVSMVESDVCQIAVLKAIGAPTRFVRRLYEVKYWLIIGVGAMLGWLIAAACRSWLVAGIFSFLGVVPSSGITVIGSLLASAGLGLVSWIFCSLVLRRLRRISPMVALRGNITAPRPLRHGLKRCRWLSVNVWLGLQMVRQYRQSYLMLGLILVVSVFFMMVPLHLYQTIRSSTFITYLGVGRSDVRMDLSGKEAAFHHLMTALRQDRRVADVMGMQTIRLKAIGLPVPFLKVDVGDQRHFPIRYLTGRSPSAKEEISLSYLNAKQLEKQVGDHIALSVDGKTRLMRVVGVYQDMTNGGLTAKSVMSLPAVPVLWQVINVRMADKSLQAALMQQYRSRWPGIRITAVDAYLQQTMAALMGQMQSLVWVSFVLGTMMMVMMTLLLTKMLLVRQRRHFSIMKVVGCSVSALKRQVMASTLFVLVVAIMVGVLLSTSIGQQLVAVIWGTMGAPGLVFVIAPQWVYLGYPLWMCVVVLCAVLWCTKVFSRAAIHDVFQE